MMRPLNRLLVAFVLVMLVAATVRRLGRPMHRDDVQPVRLDYRINLNTADADTLCLLRGIGPKLGANIVEYRKMHGPFQSVDELDNVKRIGPVTLRNVRPYVTVGD